MPSCDGLLFKKPHSSTLTTTSSRFGLNAMSRKVCIVDAYSPLSGTSFQQTLSLNNMSSLCPGFSKLRRLREGAFGVVYLAKQQSDEAVGTAY
jgi:hypothetical protein